MNIKPLNERVLVELKKQEEITKGGIIIVNPQKKDYREGIVRAIGKGYKDKNGTITPLRVKKGDKVVLTKFDGANVVVEGKSMVVLKEYHIMGVIDE